MINKKDTDNQSFTISHIEGFISKDDIRIEERIEKKETFLSILTFFFKSFLKFYGIRILYSLYHVFSSNKKSSKFNMNLFFKTVLSIPNLRTALFGSVMPSIYKLILKIFSDHFDKKYEHYFVIFSALTSSLIGILIEEKTTLVNFITLSVLFRVIHTLLIIFCEKFNIPYYGKKVNYIVFKSFSAF